ncbi:nudix hydrolase 9-like [Asparagus officinalis]|uniref:nudix hydrolase 9-like n=1 Tax=Asparagus officinalis TaxID=4686 RepID=UPI00098DFCFD|nr:nudix hydrolase 9-like [Asparagus officinalis]
MAFTFTCTERTMKYGGDSLHPVDGSEKEYSVCLHLGLTDYRTFIGTNLNPLWEKFLVPSEEHQTEETLTLHLNRQILHKRLACI